MIHETIIKVGLGVFGILLWTVTSIQRDRVEDCIERRLYGSTRFNIAIVAVAVATFLLFLQSFLYVTQVILNVW